MDLLLMVSWMHVVFRALLSLITHLGCAMGLFQDERLGQIQHLDHSSRSSNHDIHHNDVHHTILHTGHNHWQHSLLHHSIQRTCHLQLLHLRDKKRKQDIKQLVFSATINFPGKRQIEINTIHPNLLRPHKGLNPWRSSCSVHVSALVVLPPTVQVPPCIHELCSSLIANLRGHRREKDKK